jgi:hypothetical protein
MKYHSRIYYSAEQPAEIWDRWQRGELISSIGRRFDGEPSSVFSAISPTGGIRAEIRKRGVLLAMRTTTSIPMAGCKTRLLFCP